MESLELGADLLLFDEDSTASNFLVRDATMQALVPNEPITPLVVRAASLVRDTGATIVLVCGSSSAFLPTADVVVQMDRYRLRDVTSKAQELAAAPVLDTQAVSFGRDAQAQWRRRVRLASLEPNGKVTTRHRHLVQYGDETWDLQAIPQLVHVSQTRAVEQTLRQSANGAGSQPVPSVRTWLDAFEAKIENEGIDALQVPGRHDGFLARPRRMDVGAACTSLYSPVNRLREAVFERN